MQPKDFEEEMLVMERRMKDRDRRRKKVEDDNAKLLETLPFSPRMKKILAEGDNVKSPVSINVLITEAFGCFSLNLSYSTLYYILVKKTAI